MTFIDTNKHTITLFQQQVEATPGAPALEDREHVYTYTELDKKVSLLARHLCSQGIGREKLVGVLLPHTADFIIACLASLRAGGAYLILEFAYPPELLDEVIKDAQPSVLITYKSELKNVKANVPLIVLDDKDVWQQALLCEAINLPGEYDQDAVAFVSYSSGTTGQPKGVANHDRPGILSYDQRFAISDQKPGDRIACNTFFIWEMFRPLIRGATAIAVPDDISYDPVGLVDMLRSKCITETLMTPTLLASILAQFPNVGSILPNLRVLWVTGEVVTTDLARRALKALPGVRLLNSYSTSETWDTAIGDMKDIIKDSEQSMYCCVGTPLGLNQIYILDENGRQVERGARGEVYIGGPVLALGYLNLPETTARIFLPDPFSTVPGGRMYRSGDFGRIISSGALEISGRIGGMIKLRGYSVIPAMVQMNIVTRLAVRDCAVVSYGAGLDQQLIAYFVRDGDESDTRRPVVEVDNSGFSPQSRRILSQYLAEYMIPAHWVEVTQLPADPISGKIDRKRLPPRSVTLGGSIAPESTITDFARKIDINTIAQIWAATLNIPSSAITSEHSFFDLGGHSLSLATLSAKFSTLLGSHVPVAQLVHSPKLAGHLATILAIKNGGTKFMRKDLLAQLCSDRLLQEEIQPVNKQMYLLEDADVVLLTGATGFLGAFLLYDLLQITPAKILCLLRPNSSAKTFQSGLLAQQKLRQSLLDKGLHCEHLLDRVEIVSGDLSQGRFGLSTEAFRELAVRTKVIIHAGAAVNLIYPYAALRDINVSGTTEILRLASLGGATVHYISTNSVLPPSPPGAKDWSEDAKVEIEEVSEKLKDGYGQSKWVAEQLVTEASRRGFPVRIVRVGTISGHSITGVSNNHDLLTALISESIELGYAPETNEWRAEMSPVDLVSKEIIRLCNTRALRFVFHLGDPDPLSAFDLFTVIRQLGYTIQPLDWDEWIALWTEKRRPDRSRISPTTDTVFNCMPYIKELMQVAVLSNSEIEPYYRATARPKISSTILEQYTRYWFSRGWISRPPAFSDTEHN